MTKLSKRVKAIQSKVDRNKFYPLEDALNLVKECATAKFDESIDVAVQLGIDAKKSDQVVRGAVVLPAGTGKHVRVAVFAQGEKAEQAKEEAQTALLMQLRAADSASCDAGKFICVRWQNPNSDDLNMRGQGTAYRINQDNVAEVKTSGADSNTFISITHNDNTAVTVIGDPNAILNIVIIKQNVGIAKVQNR